MSWKSLRGAMGSPEGNPPQSYKYYLKQESFFVIF